MESKMIVPFSNGTEAMMWLDHNCDRCVKAFHPDMKKGWPSEKTLKEYVRIGKYCKLQYDLDIAHITSEIPIETAIQIGMEECGLKEQCMFYSDNENDGFNYPKQPKPDNTPNNQLVMPFILDEITIGFRKKATADIETTEYTKI